jgi:thioredoxin reductase (NADPH)
MAHLCFVEPAGLHAPRGYSHAVLTDGPLVHVAGQVALGPDGALVGLGDLGAQAERALANPKIEPVWNSTVAEYLTDEGGEMRAVKLKNLVTGEESELELKCVFVAIGHVPNSGFLGDLVDKDENGYILQNPGRTSTKTEGLFAAGDVADHYYRQAVTAAGQGCAAALEAERYLSDHE